MQNLKEGRDIPSFIKELNPFIKQSFKRLSWFKTFKKKENMTALKQFYPTR